MPLSRRTLLLALAAAPFAGAAVAGSPAGGPWVFPSIDGGTLDLTGFRGGPVLIVNTASRCTATPQYDVLQTLWNSYRARGLTVVGVPSNSFGQELASDGEVRDFCEVNFSIDFPMTGLVEVKGPTAHPFYVWAAQQGYAPSWNFYKLLLDADGAIVTAFDHGTEPDAPEVIAAINAALPTR